MIVVYKVASLEDLESKNEPKLLIHAARTTSILPDDYVIHKRL
jgi:hypothetical protein